MKFSISTTESVSCSLCAFVYVKLNIKLGKFKDCECSAHSA